MINFIIIVFTLAVFYWGFRCGAKYRTISEFSTAAKTYVKHHVDSIFK